MAASVEKQKWRVAFMKSLYESTGGHSANFASMYKLGTSLQIPPDEIDSVADYLKDSGLLKIETHDGLVTITRRGIDEIERAILSPDRETRHLAPINIINIQNMHNSQVQQGSPAASQSMQTPIDLERLLALLEVFRHGTELFDALDPATAAEAKAEITTLEAQLASSKPKRIVIVEALKSLKTICEGAIGNVAAAAAQPHIQHLLASLS